MSEGIVGLDDNSDKEEEVHVVDESDEGGGTEPPGGGEGGAEPTNGGAGGKEATGGGEGAEPRSKENSQTEDEENEEQEGYGDKSEAEDTTGGSKKADTKPSRNILERIRERNSRGLEQDPSLIGPGTILFIRWTESVRKEIKAPYNTPWAYVRLTELCDVTKPEAPTYNWTHHKDENLTGHIKLQSMQAWEIIKDVATKEEQISRVERQRSATHPFNILKAP